MNVRLKRKLITLGMVLVLVIVFSVTIRDFFAWNNLSNLFRGASYLGIIAAGLTIVIISGGNDLSTGATVGLTAMVISRLLYANLPIPLCILGGCLIGLLCGFINGTLITRLHLPDFVATLSTNYIFSGLILLVTFTDSGRMITRAITNRDFLAIGGGVGGVYYVTIAWIAAILLTFFLLKKTKFGTYVYAVGTNANAAKITGINVRRIKTLGYMIGGLMSAIAAVFVLGYEGAAAPKTGEIYTFNAICATVIGGAALTGGYGDAVGTFLGCLFIQLLNNGIYKLNLSSEYQTLLVGVAIISMSMFNTIYNRRSNRRLREIGARQEAVEGGARQ